MNLRLIFGSLCLHLLSLFYVYILYHYSCALTVKVFAKCYMVIVVYKFGVFPTSTRVRYQVPPYSVTSVRSIIPPFILE